jgi:CO/xanthine dehydrogenase Mo-binding subunit
MRGFGVPQVTFAIEGLLDELAERVGIDGWEIRWRNALESGDRFGTGQLLGPGVGLKQTLLAVRDAYRSARYAGIACGAKNTGIGNGMVERGRAILAPQADGTSCCATRGPRWARASTPRCARSRPHELGMAGRADPRRGRHRARARHRRDDRLARHVLGGQAVLPRGAGAARRARARRPYGARRPEFAGEFVVDWTTPIGEGIADPVTHLAYGWATQVVILDDEGRLARVVAAQDVGRAHQPQIVEGQIEGGVHMGLGYALSEEFVVEDGHPRTETLKSLNIIPAAGMPPVETILVEEPQPEGPYGAKGAGEAVLVPTAAAVAGALYAFDGIRRRQPADDRQPGRAGGGAQAGRARGRPGRWERDR